MFVDRTSEYFAVLTAMGASPPISSPLFASGGFPMTVAPSTTPAAHSHRTGHAATPSGKGTPHGSAASSSFAMPETRSAFLRAAAEVSHDLHSTSAKLTALTKLVKRRGMFADVGEDIDRLTGGVKDDMQSLSQRLDILQEFVNRHKSAAEAGGWKAGQKHYSHSSTTHNSSNDGDDVLSTVQGISHGSVIINQMRGTLMSFTKSLRGILEDRSASMRSQAQRLQVFGRQKDLGRAVSSSELAGHTSTSAARESGRGSGDAVIDMGHTSSSTAIVSASGAHKRGASSSEPFAQVSQQQLLQSSESSYLEARAADVQIIERHMNDLSQMFSRLAGVVSEQGAMVERIEDNLQQSEKDLESGMTELQKFRDRVFSNRRLAFKIASILVIFIILFVMFGT